jgi:hypothetical protein
MKKVIVLIVGYLILGVIITVCQSCLGYDDWIKDIVFKGICPSQTPDVDDMTKSIGFEIETIGGGQAQASIIKNIDFFSKCYAIKVCPGWQNDLDISSFSMKFNRDFVCDLDTINSGIDIFEIESIKNNISINKNVNAIGLHIK